MAGKTAALSVFGGLMVLLGGDAQAAPKVEKAGTVDKVEKVGAVGAVDKIEKVDKAGTVGKVGPATNTTVASVEPMVSMTAATMIGALDSVELIKAGGAVAAVLTTLPSSAGNPEGITVIRGANHSIPRTAPGKPLTLLRVIGDAAGSIFVWYTQYNGQGGQDPHIRRIAADNSKAFDLPIMIERLAGIAADGADGVYVASHHFLPKPGEFYVSMTEHRTYRLSPTGAVLWEVHEAAVPWATGAPDHWSAAAPVPGGVVVGYAVGGADINKPVVLRRAAADGALTYKNTNLKAMSSTGAAGAVGSAPLAGRVDRLRAAADGSVLAVIVNNSTTDTLVHLDASGVQRAAFTCTGGFHEHGADEMACVHTPNSSTLHYTRYGVRDGGLKSSGTFTWTAPAGWAITTVADTGSGPILIAGQKNGGITLALLSAQGALLDTYAQGVQGKLQWMIAESPSKWIGYSKDGSAWMRASGPWSGGTQRYEFKMNPRP